MQVMTETILKQRLDMMLNAIQLVTFDCTREVTICFLGLMADAIQSAIKEIKAKETIFKTSTQKPNGFDTLRN